MKRKIIALTLCALLFALSFPAEAQQASKKIPGIGFLSANSPAAISARIEALRQGLRELGYVEGKNIVIEWRSAEGKPDRLPALATELARLKVDVFVASGPEVTRAAKEATTTIPIVMTHDPDPVGNGLVTSLARPGGNITGLSALSSELSGKQLELLKEVVPKLSRVGVLGNSTSPGAAQMLKEVKVAAEALGIQLQYLEVQAPKDIETSFRAASKGHADAVLARAGPVADSHRTQLADLAVKNRLPGIYDRREFVDDGGLMSYGTNFADLSRRAATYVDKILKGAKPADLPVEQPRKFELVINLKTAKQIGVTIPPEVLARANRLIK